MRNLSVLLGCVTIILPVSALGQMGPGSTADGTDAVKSNSLGVPGPTKDPMNQLIERQGLQDLSTRKSMRQGEAALGPARPAKKDELTVGATVNDKTGSAMAKIESVDADGVLVSIGTAKVKVPADAFGHNRAGLLLDMTKAQFEQVVAKANTAS